MRCFMSAFGVDNDELDTAAAERLAVLVRHASLHVAAAGKETISGSDAALFDTFSSRSTRWRSVLLAFDGRYDRETGELLREMSPMIVPNDYIFDMAAQYPDAFVPACSVNPLRKDAVAELERCAARGSRICKWLPNSMRFSPADDCCDPFYDACVRLNMSILCHVGDETSVDMLGARVDNTLGNPLLLRRALAKGVKVIAAHFASEGSSIDDDGKRSENFNLLLGMMENPAWKQTLFADISAMTIFKRLPKLVSLLEHPELLARCVFGSDYPVPCLGGRIIGTRPQPFALMYGGFFAPQLAASGLLSRADATALDEIFQYNPLLFDLVLKLVVCHPSSGVMLPATLFGPHPLLPPAAAAT